MNIKKYKITDFYKIFKRLELKFKYIYFKKNLNTKKKYQDSDFSDIKINMNFYFSYIDSEKVFTYYQENESIRNFSISEAEEVLNHSFYVLGPNPIKIEKNINWNKDYISGYIWKEDYYRDIKIIDFSNTSDVKRVWELSRFNHLFTLGKAFWITKDEKYYQEFKDQVICWEKQNPYCNTVNWTCAMEVAIRAINWIFAYFHFEEVINQDKEFKNKITKLLYIHGEFIYNNLENYNRLRNNHYITNLTGLLYLGIFFSESKYRTAKKWKNKAIRDLHREIKIQINEDGTSYETSTNYHRVDLELFLHSYMIGCLNNIEFHCEYKNKLKDMYIFLKSIMKPNKLIPLIGDVDNGRLLSISNYYDVDNRDFSSIMSITEYYLDVLKNSENNFFQYSEDVLWLSNDGIPKIFEEPDLSTKNEYVQGGLYLLKNKKIYMLIRAGDLSLKGHGGHSHNDQLSFELNMKGIDIIVDPGSYTYSGSIELRNNDRMTKNHNTISINNIEQNDFTSDIFSMKEQTFSKIMKFDDTEFVGEHYGYENKAGIIHKRKVNLKNNGIKVVDILKGKRENHDVYQNFILAPGVKVKLLDDKIVLVSNEISIYSNLCINDCEISDVFISKGYGKREKSKKIQRRIKENIYETSTEFYF
ncbi:alginate lyase family protein [Enterococcus alcedinis]|uniref:Heparin-sulfate lyase N-terminal domain-containing protein n=1 Tax=Enterococcus alcedinis TaxID=1274384 RepID=A0A917N4F1_9ENTE|nr:alginate lyase family protein [Enterococcus alcedinis]MBP2102098.1 hypothetical protein [Enterococcus alcedinis]GGI65660.1 hypothetical protein GCM10011482_13140 [Enterococcus alcedinis]